VAAGYAEEARTLAQTTVLGVGGFGQEDVTSPAFLAWTKAQGVGECLDRVLAILAALASQVLAARDQPAACAGGLPGRGPRRVPAGPGRSPGRARRGAAGLGVQRPGDALSARHRVAGAYVARRTPAYAREGMRAAVVSRSVPGMDRRLLDLLPGVAFGAFLAITSGLDATPDPAHRDLDALAYALLFATGMGLAFLRRAPVAGFLVTLVVTTCSSRSTSRAARCTSRR
jgi:hypothetical protein